MDERTNHILRAFIVILALGRENCRFQLAKTSANKRFYKKTMRNFDARRVQCFPPANDRFGVSPTRNPIFGFGGKITTFF